MPTDNYENAASSYKQLFVGQNRANDTAAVSTNDQFDRDNLLHFVEEKFKTNKKGGVSLVNLRALFHTLIKSVSMVKDDKNLVVIGQRSGIISSTHATKNYFGSPTEGFNGTTWSAYANSASTMRSAESNAAIRLPFLIVNPTVKGSIQCSSTGNVTISAYYTDQDDGTNAYVQNPVLIGVKVQNCAIANTNYNFDITNAGMKIPADKLIWILVENTGFASGTETLKIALNIYGNTHSANWSNS